MGREAWPLRTGIGVPFDMMIFAPRDEDEARTATISANAAARYALEEAEFI